jgi:hypothetical protein
MVTRRIFQTALSLLMLGALAGCPINLDTECFPTTQPNSSDLVGVYHPIEKTIELVTKTGGYPLREMSITLNVDGTFRLENIPDWWSFGESHGGFESGSGKWTTKKSQSWWELRLVHTKPGMRTQMDLCGHEPPYEIWLYVSDPDCGRVMRFAKNN